MLALITKFASCYSYYLLVQKPLGLISLLDEESNFPKATDLTFANKVRQHLSANPCFKGERGRAFCVRHYAGEVSHCSIFRIFVFGFKI